MTTTELTEDGRPALDTIPGYSDFLTKLADRLKELPPVPVFAQSAFFPSDHAWKFERAGYQYFCANKAFWEQVPERVEQVDSNPFVLGGITIVDIDEPANARRRAQVMTAITEHVRDRDASLAEDAKRLSPEGVAARAEGIAQGEDA
jgi:hypothetical protein